ncbi:MAG: type II secretion system F family protein [archaeon]
MKFVFLEEFGKAFIPKKIRPMIRKYLVKAGVPRVPYRLFGGLFYLSIVITAIIYIAMIHPLLVEREASVIVFLITTFLFWVILQLLTVMIMMVSVYIYYEQGIYNRTKRIELVLPEFLRYVSENLKGGMSFEKALWDAIRPKFGILAQEIRLAAKKVMTGEDIEQALWEFTEKYDSPTVKRTFSLIIEGMKGGHEIADLIDRIQINLRQTKDLKDEISATNSTYMVFLSSIALLIAPALFALAYNLLAVLDDLTSRMVTATGGGANVPLNLGAFDINPGDFVIFTMWAIACISGFAAVIVSIIRKGSVRPGLKYIPIYIISSIIVYFIFQGILISFFGQMV